MHAAAVVQILPPVAALFASGTLSPEKRWVVGWCLLLAVQDALGFALASADITNLWLGSVGAPLAGAVALWMLSQWHEDGTGRLALRVAVPIFVAVSVSLSVWVDDPTTFSLFAAPFHHLVLLLAALWTFVSRGLRAQRSLGSSDWFWILTGFMLYMGTSTAVQAVIWYLLETGRQDLFLGVFNVKAGATLVAFVAIAGGMLCPTPPTHSGGRSSRPFSRSPSS